MSNWSGSVDLFVKLLFGCECNSQIFFLILKITTDIQRGAEVA